MRTYLRGWDRWYRHTLPAYWVFLFSVTHLPQLRPPVSLPESDKLAHFVAYALLAFLLWRFRESFGRPVSSSFIWLAAVGLVAFAAVDEYTQPFVGRDASWLDWVCDAAGVLSVLTVLEWRRRSAKRLDSSRVKT